MKSDYARSKVTLYVHRLPSIGYCFWRDVDEGSAFEAQKPGLAGAGPKLIPTAVQRMHDSVRLNDIRADVREHRVKESHFLPVGW